MGAIKTICVCGAGTMGSGIAQVAAQNGFDVIQFDVNDQVLIKSRGMIESGLQKLVGKGKITLPQKSEIENRIVYTSDIKKCIAGLVIEAVVENENVKQQLFDELFSINSPSAIFATNTSSLSISKLCANKKYASRFAGMHFFNPAPIMKLVEIIRADKTNEEIIETLTGVAKQLGKTPVVCNDAPGFIVNRVARHYYLEALQLLDEGAATVETIDEIMEASGFKMGPFKLMDLIGLDINYSVSNIVWEALGRPERLKPSLTQKNKVEAKELGRKTGSGFYNY